MFLMLIIYIMHKNLKFIIMVFSIILISTTTTGISSPSNNFPQFISAFHIIRIKYTNELVLLQSSIGFCTVLIVA